MKPGVVLKALFISLSVMVANSSQTWAGTELKLNKGIYNTKELALSNKVFSEVGSSDYVIQFVNAVTEQNKSELRNLGVKVYRYLPDDALIVKAPLSVLNQFAHSNSEVNAVVPFKGAWKTSENLPMLNVFSARNKVPLLVSLFDSSDLSTVKAQIEMLSEDLTILSVDDRYIAVLGNLSLVMPISNLTGVEFVQKIEKMNPLSIVLEEGETNPPQEKAAGDYSDLTGYETGTKVINMDYAWALGYSGEGQIVGMADTGLDLGDTTKVSTDFQNAIVSGYHFGAGAKDWSDPMGHGTHVAGSVLGRGAFSGGKLKGAAYSAKMVAQSMWSPILDNLNVPAQLSKLFEPAYKDGARMHTNSWGAASNFGVYESMAQKVDDFMWTHPDFLILFAAGNSGVDMNKDGKIDPNSVGTPGTAKNCLTVGASENLVSNGGIQKKVSELRTAKDTWPAEPIWSSKLSDNIDGVAMFSSRGPTTDKRLKPEVVAPGTNVLSARSHQTGAELLWGAYNDNYVWSGGTSMATPLTAGFAAVTREILVKKYGMQNPSAALLKALIMHTAHDMYPGQYGEGSPTQELTRRPNNDEGYGRVDMKAVTELTSNTKMFDEAAGVGQGETFEKTLQLSQGQSVLVNLVYTDAPGTPSAKATLVNDIDLVLVTPDGKEIASHDGINNNEIIEKAGLAAGTYKLQVKGVKVPMGKNGKQPFALVATVR